MGTRAAPRAAVPDETTRPLTSLLDAWVTDDVITREQADQIGARHDADLVRLPTVRPRPGASLATEALGYIGGVVVMVGTILIANLYWDELDVTTRVTVMGIAAALLCAGGLAVPSGLGDVGVRLRSVLWLASTVAFGGFLGLLGAGVLDLSGADTAVLTTSGTAVVAAVFWRAHRHLAQQLATMVALMATAAALVADYITPDHWPGAGAWLVAGVWLALSWGGLLTPRRPVMGTAAAALIVASVSTLPTDGGFALAIGTVTAIVAMALLQADLVLFAIGAVGTLVVLPSAVSEWFPGSAAAPLALLGVGLALVGMAVWTARRRHDQAD